MTWTEIAAQINRKLVQFASPMVLTDEMVGLLNETYNDLLNEWYKLTFERDEMAIQLLSPLKQASPSVSVTGTIFYLDTTNFPGGLRWISTMRGAFVQACSGVAESRNIEFMSDNDVSDLDNPLRKPDNDHPRYRLWYDVSANKKKVTIYCATPVPTTVDVLYYRNPVVLTSLTGSPEISLEGHFDIVRRAVFKQCGINYDERTPIAKAETDTDLQIKVT
jgi:hypothetical protein